MADITLRLATAVDADLLLNWRNDPATRANSRNSTEITPQEHATWLATKLANSDCQLMIAENDGFPVGTVRADWNGKTWELSWTVGRNARGRGHGRAMVMEMTRSLDGPIRAEIKIGNIASEHIALAVGMAIVREQDNMRYYEVRDRP